MIKTGVPCGVPSTKPALPKKRPVDVDALVGVLTSVPKPSKTQPEHVHITR